MARPDRLAVWLVALSLLGSAQAGVSPEIRQALLQRDFVGAEEIWAGVVAPQSSLGLVKTILTSVFAAEGTVVEGAEPRPLAVREVSAENLRAEHVFLIVDKPGRTQTITSVIAVSPRRHDVEEELAADFGRHVLVDSGLGSIFGEEIRTKRGLAYSVMGVHAQYLGYPSLGVATNPLRPKSDEALDVIAEWTDPVVVLAVHVHGDATAQRGAHGAGHTTNCRGVGRTALAAAEQVRTSLEYRD